MDGAQKFIDAMKKVNKSNQTKPSEIVSCTAISKNPLVFQLENRLQINSNFYELSNCYDWTKVEVGDIFRAFSFNEGQKYYIIEKTPYNTNNNPAIIADQVAQIASQIVNMITIPIGGGCEFFGATAPTNFVFADGQALSIAEYPELYAVIGETYRKSDNQDLTTFNVPDLTDRVPVMKGTLTMFNTLGTKVGESKHTLTKQEIPNYNLTVTDPGHTHTYQRNDTTYQHNFDRAGGSPGVDSYNSYQTNTGSKTTGITVSSGGSGNAMNNTQLSLVCNFIIRVK